MLWQCESYEALACTGKGKSIDIEEDERRFIGGTDVDELTPMGRNGSVESTSTCSALTAAVGRKGGANSRGLLNCPLLAAGGDMGKLAGPAEARTPIW